MSQITIVGNNSKDESSLVFANDESVISFLLEKIPQIAGKGTKQLRCENE